jgi:hypothetical protein
MIPRRTGLEKKGAGRKVAIEHQPLLKDNFLNLLAHLQRAIRCVMACYGPISHALRSVA